MFHSLAQWFLIFEDEYLKDPLLTSACALSVPLLDFLNVLVGFSALKYFINFYSTTKLPIIALPRS
ncbi:MAG: hypothetical protein ACMG6E_09310 [Candidatus Roizmanbacteria bacterium]